MEQQDYRINWFTCKCCGRCVVAINVDCPTCGTPKEDN